MSGVLGAWPAREPWQHWLRSRPQLVTTGVDAEPGKLPHELRRGELAFRKVIPHTPYYGTTTPALYCRDICGTDGAGRVMNPCLDVHLRRPNPCQNGVSN